MNKKFKRLLSLILAFVMVIGMMPFQGLTTVQAASSAEANSTFYLDATQMLNSQYWDEGQTITAHIWYDGTPDGNASASFTMSAVPGKDHWYSVTIPQRAWKIKVQRGSYNAAELRFDSRNNDFVNVLKINGWNSAYWNGTYNGGGSSGGQTTTALFNVSADLVDYFNNGRVKQPYNTLYNEGDKTGPNNAPYSKLNQWISGLQGYALPGTGREGIPLYFGDLLHYGQGGGDLSWYWQGANVAFGPNIGTANKDVAQGIVGDYLVDGNLVTSYTDSSGNFVKVPLFNENAYPNQSTYMRFYNNLQFPFTATTTNGVTKYSFNSKENTVYYDYGNKKIVRDDNLVINDVGGQRGYFPFNKVDPSAKDNLNYGFGTKFTIPFTIASDGKDANGQDVTFNFTGDDDVWVYIDGALVLDMGGAHELAHGTINFATKKAMITTGTSDAKIGNQLGAGGRASAVDNGRSSVDFSRINVKLADGSITTLDQHMAKENEVHTLVMYYMERGMWNSNMSIDFSFIPIPSGLTLSKDVNVADVNPGLQEVVKTKDTFDFTVKTNENTAGNYQPVNGVDYILQYDGFEADETIGADGKVKGLADNISAHSFEKDGESAFKLGTYFEVTEDMNSNYTTRWEVTENKELVTSGSGTNALFQLGEADENNPFANVNYNVNFVNTPKVAPLTLKKEWQAGQTAQNGPFSFTVLVDLEGGTNYGMYDLTYTVGGDTKIAVSGEVSLEVGQTATFEGIPVGASYQIVENVPADVNWSSDKTDNTVNGTITEGANAVTFTNKTNEVAVHKFVYVEAGDEPTAYIPDDVTITGAELISGQTDDSSVVTNDGTLNIKAKTADEKYVYKIGGTVKNGGQSLTDDSTLTVFSFKATRKVYVFDYGLKSDLTRINDNNDGLFQGGVFFNKEAQKTVDYRTTAMLGAVSENGATPKTDIIAGNDVFISEKDGSSLGGPVTFVPTGFMDQVENYKYTANIMRIGSDFDPADPETGTVVNGTIKVMPASVVYYEDNFNAGTATEDSSMKIIYTGNKETEGTSLDLSQSNDQTEEYGHDDAYNTTDNQQDSGGSSTKLTADGYNTKAIFTFTGAGFDVIARTTTKTAGIIYTIEKYDQATDKYSLARMGAVDTLYTNGALYQLPVIHEDLEYGTYRVTLGIKQTGNYLVTKDENGNIIREEDTRKYVVYLDGIRIYNPLPVGDKDREDNYLGDELDATVSKVPELIVGNGTVTDKGILDEDGNIVNSQVVDGATAVIASYDSVEGLAALGTTWGEVSTDSSSSSSESVLTYLNAGPNNELYLDDSAALAFVVKATDAVKTLQIEAKLVDVQGTEDFQESNGLNLRVLSNKSGTVEEKEIDTIYSSTAMYYRIPVEECISLGGDYYLVAILGNSDFEEGGSHVLSFSNLKYKNYTIGNPYDTKEYDASDYLAANAEISNNFVSVNLKTGLKKNAWQSYNDHSVTLTQNVFGAQEPKFTMYYVNAAGDKVALSVTAQKVADDDKTYRLRFKTPNAKGNFPVEIHYVVDGEESGDYISTVMKVTK